MSKSASTHVSVIAAWNPHTQQLAIDQGQFSKALKRLKPEAGETFVVRVEREQDAKRYWQLKFYFGFLVKQCAEYTGHTAADLDLEFRARFLPPDVPTLSLLTYEQMRDFTMHCEVYAAETIGVQIVGPDDARYYTPEGTQVHV